MKRRRFAPKQHMTQTRNLMALRDVLELRATWPPSESEIASLMTSYGMAWDVVQTEVALQDMRRRHR